MAETGDLNIPRVWGLRWLYSILKLFVRFAMWVTRCKVAEIYYRGWPLPKVAEYIATADEVWFVVHTGMQLDATNIIANEERQNSENYFTVSRS